jgi:hypothetical protein
MSLMHSLCRQYTPFVANALLQDDDWCCCGCTKDHVESILFWVFTCFQRGRSGRAGISYRQVLVLVLVLVLVSIIISIAITMITPSLPPPSLSSNNSHTPPSLLPLLLLCRAYSPLKRTEGDGDGMSDWSERSDSTLVRGGGGGRGSTTHPHKLR